MLTKDQIAENIALVIKGSGKTHNEIAEAIGVGRTSISEYIAGRVTPSVFIIMKLCQVLDCTYEDILGRLD